MSADRQIAPLETWGDRWRKQALANIDEWGVQDRETLLLAAQEELGELTQAVLEATAEDGDPSRVREELDDLGGLLVQLHHVVDESGDDDTSGSDQDLVSDDPFTELQRDADGNLDHDDPEHLERAYERYDTMADAAEEFGVSYQAFYNRLCDHGIHEPSSYDTKSDDTDDGTDGSERETATDAVDEENEQGEIDEKEANIAGEEDSQEEVDIGGEGDAPAERRDIDTGDGIPADQQAFVLEWGRWGPPLGGTYHVDEDCFALDRSDSDREVVPLPASRDELREDEDWEACGHCSDTTTDDVDKGADPDLDVDTPDRDRTAAEAEFLKRVDDDAGQPWRPADDGGPDDAGATRTCRGCGREVSEAYARVFAPDGESQPRCCPDCEDLIREGDGTVREKRYKTHDTAESGREVS